MVGNHDIRDMTAESLFIMYQMKARLAVLMDRELKRKEDDSDSVHLMCRGMRADLEKICCLQEMMRAPYV
ncbi:MAG: hypothetical protein R8M45_11950 [Ghiorsea sp.]